MSSIISAVFKATIGLIANKARDKAAENLKEGDVTDQKFRSLVVREIDDIKSKLDGTSRKDLLASISFFQEGIEILYHVFGSTATSREQATTQVGEVSESAAASAIDDTSKQALARTLQQRGSLELTDLDESALKMLTNAKERFKDARRKATEAFNNESLKLPDRILAMKYRVMAGILEAIDNYFEALPACKVCLKELHALPEVRKNFKVHVQKGFMSWMGKDDRLEIIFAVCQINHVMYDVFRTRSIFDSWLYVDVGDDKIDPLRDGTVAKALRNAGLPDFSWSFGREGERLKRLENPDKIVANSKGDFIVTDADDEDGTDGVVKVFNPNGQYLYYLDPRKFFIAIVNLKIMDIAIDQEDNVYLLALGELTTSEKMIDINMLLMFDKKGKLTKKLLLVLDCADRAHSLAIIERNIFVSTITMVYIYSNEGGNPHRSLDMKKFDHSDTLIDKVVAAGDRVMVVAKDRDTCRLHFFTEQGEHLHKFEVKLGPQLNRLATAFHRASGHVLIFRNNFDIETELVFRSIRVLIYTECGEFVNSVVIRLPDALSYPLDMAVTSDGHIAISMSRGAVCVW